MRGSQLIRRWRLALFAAIFLSATFVVMCVGILLIDWIGGEVIATRQLNVAESARDYFVDFAHEEGLAPLARALDRRERSQDHEGFRYALFSNGGTLMGGARLLRIDQLPGFGTSQVTVTTGGRSTLWQVLVQPIAVGGTLVVYEDLRQRAAFQRALVAGASSIFGGVVGFVLLASFWLNRHLYQRAQAIAATASLVADGTMSARAPADPDGDAFDRLAVAINAMLDRNEELVTGLRTVTDSLAHDLRSPLTRMKAALSTALNSTVGEDVRLREIDRAWTEADRALATTAALLDIARAETGLSRDMFQPVVLGRLVADVAELFEPVLEDAGQTISVEPTVPQVTLLAHDVLLRQSVGSLLHNAALYAGKGANVRVEVQSAPGIARLVVADTGPGIPEKDRGRVLERFIRLDAARTAPGSGLGLAIAAACAKLHGGTLSLEDNRPGLRVVLTLAT